MRTCTFCRAYLGVNALLLLACLVLLWLPDAALATTNALAELDFNGADGDLEARRLTSAEREERLRRRLRKLHAEQWAAVIADADDKGVAVDYRCAWKAGAGVRINADNAAAWAKRGYRIELPCCASHGGPRYNDVPPLGVVATCDCVPSAKGCAKYEDSGNVYCYESFCRSCVWPKSAFDACSGVSPYAPHGYAMQNELGEYAQGVVTCGGTESRESLVKRDVDAIDATLPCTPVTAGPTPAPTSAPTSNPTASPTGAPQEPTASPTMAPTSPTASPTAAPTQFPTTAPTPAPTQCIESDVCIMNTYVCPAFPAIPSTVACTDIYRESGGKVTTISSSSPLSGTIATDVALLSSVTFM